MKILAIDPGYGRCGWAILAKGEKELRITNYKLRNGKNKKSSKSEVRNSEIELVACDLIETDKRKNLPERLVEIYDAIEYLIEKYKPRQLAIESLFWFKNQKTAMAVAQVRGVIIVAAKNKGLEVSEYTPLQVKQAVVGYGKATKNQVQKMIKLHLSGQCVSKQDDTADAIAVGLTHVSCSRMNLSQIIPKDSQMIPKKSRITELITNNIKIETDIISKNNHLVYPELSYRINGLLFKIHNKLGGGYQEKYYYKPIDKELKTLGISFKKQLVVDLRYQDMKLGRYIIDYVIDRKIVLEIKVTPYFSKRDIKQVLAYLERSRLELGILASFTKKKVLIKRILRGYDNN